ncbi:MAG: SRPBCC family protein [Geminicoccaceae bacterium]
MIDVISSKPGANPVTIEAVFPTTAARLFDAWTQPEQLRQWFGMDPSALGDIQIDLREGGVWRFVMRCGDGREEVLEGRYLEILPGERLAFSWSHKVKTSDGGDKRTPPSRVTIQFEPMGAATRMTLEHVEIVTDGGRVGVRKGWQASFRALADLVAPDR